jgi:hypothetical protein
VATNIVALEDEPLLPTDTVDITIVIGDDGEYIPPVEAGVDDALELMMLVQKQMITNTIK